MPTQLHISLVMKIFYGVQGTGNGHVTRARVMARELNRAGIQVTFQFSGREPSNYFEMAIFKDFLVKKGLTFHVEKGFVSYWRTALDTKPLSFIREIKDLDLSGYDLVISDFEPVTSWSAKLQKKPVLGLGHQYAFAYSVPKAGGDPIAEILLQYFAPADRKLGLHWHSFGQPVLPPIIDVPEWAAPVLFDKIVVYLPFEDQRKVVRILAHFTSFEFHVFAPLPAESTSDHIHCYPLSVNGFKEALADCSGVISNAGFELVSEALQLGKKILVKPLHAQMEQISNAAALEQLGYGRVMFDLEAKIIAQWLDNRHAVRINYPNTARLIVQWLEKGMPDIDARMLETFWQGVRAQTVDLQDQESLIEFS